MERDGLIFRRRVMVAGVDYDGASRNQSMALAHIHDYYKKALHRLPPELIPSLLEAGFCFGFLDPVSNIIANTVSHELDRRKKERKKRTWAGKEKGCGESSSSSKSESRRAAISKITAEECSKNICLIPWATDSRNSMLRNSSIAARSLRGLVAFLTSYFRYLTPWDALRYLSLSKADLLVAVHLIQEDRHTDTFSIHHPTAKIALACAAIFALHTAVDTLVSRSFLLASSVDEASSLLHTQGRIGNSTIKALSQLLLTSSSIKDSRMNPMQQAVTRLQHWKTKSIQVGAGLEVSLKMVLLDRIHLLYLEAISCIPKHELCSRHHRGLLKAGHCYGPFDPVTNIILNTIWYDTMFPPKHHFEAGMICTKSLARIECLSLCGLVAYLRVRFPTFSVYEALRCLLICNASLDKVIEMAKTDGHVEDIHFSDSLAYGTASHAARHPSPSEHAEFIIAVLPQLRGTLWSTGKVKRVLSSSDVRTISESLSKVSPPPSKSSLNKVQKLTRRATKIISAHRQKFEDCQGTIVEVAQAALRRYAKQEGQDYELHFICDVNSTIPEHGVIYCPHSYNYPYCHMNIWARRRASQNDNADQAPTLFFIQCRNIDEDMQDMAFLCCPISDLSKDAGRCYHCEYEGTKIVHPSSESYLGLCKDFEDMARGETAVDTEGLVEQGQTNTLFDRTLEDEDSVYFDPAWDVDFSVFINHTAREQAKYEKLRNMKDNSWIEKLVREESLACST